MEIRSSVGSKWLRYLIAMNTTFISTIIFYMLVSCNFAFAFQEESVLSDNCRDTLDVIDPDIGLANFPNKSPVNFTYTKKTITVIVFGQSMAANYLPTRMSGGKGCYQLNILDNKFYFGDDPFLGTTGFDGSITSILGKLLIENGYEQVLFVNVAVGGTSIRHWIGCGSLYNRVLKANYLLLSHKIHPDVILWIHGESDANRLKSYEYLGLFATMVYLFRENGITAPIVISKSTKCMNNGSDQILFAQNIIPKLLINIYSGPNTDSIGGKYRYDDCHFNDEGAFIAAKMWLDKLLELKHKKIIK